MLYNYPREPATNCGIMPDKDFLYEIKSEVTNWGKCLFFV
jgi:hypothetical protein